MDKKKRPVGGPRLQRSERYRYPNAAATPSVVEVVRVVDVFGFESTRVVMGCP